MLFYDILANPNLYVLLHLLLLSMMFWNVHVNRKLARQSVLTVLQCIVNGGLKSAVHLSILFNLFLTVQYFPSNFQVQLVIIPLAKSKSGDLADVNNYRAIAISTSMSELFECVIASEVCSKSEYDKYQFGFKGSHSTGLCTSIFKKTVDYYTCRGSYVFTCFIDFTKAFLIVSIIGSCSVNCQCYCCIGILHCYSHQLVCVRWFNSLSNCFYSGNCTRQGGMLSPNLFNRYIRDLLAQLDDLHVGLNIGGLFINELAYADDIVLLAPSWKALQQLLQFLNNISLILTDL